VGRQAHGGVERAAVMANTNPAAKAATPLPGTLDANDPAFWNEPVAAEPATCTWCGEPADPELGPLNDQDQHPGCADSQQHGAMATHQANVAAAQHRHRPA